MPGACITQNSAQPPTALSVCSELQADVKSSASSGELLAPHDCVFSSEECPHLPTMVLLHHSRTSIFPQTVISTTVWICIFYFHFPPAELWASVRWCWVVGSIAAHHHWICAVGVKVYPCGWRGNWLPFSIFPYNAVIVWTMRDTSWI